ncbi:thiamine pyrophosphate-binding protein [Chroococcidiopsis thermalis]|jgi:thiamine pyrophosphate-dependent acetolactate synthase large subunit-like protein|uniref:Thiamine pyrophosphate TPP-binding domain-containing protein n=1 Tax=Chroococcidiopsis thermalis (strain PCC 7203) TaxID=251229 RepID=K9U532_CHRTP|nr:thiamine pyrophosphate-binding protein [Chroococcidiopsis thermalis]AFY89930.1 thiamine pyrophosphate TPP-binding domain-containing protein [Chroococcidiopsis thermalis PCC 7203]PSB45328.1 thiamine pyrophosphate-binding protein [Cyanosarcina cf. burmensis CCALA 770]
MINKTGRFAILEQFLADGIRYIFGNPGTVEQGFLDALWEYPDLKYILTLQETVAVMAADGYARATRKPTVVQIHSTPGLGNAIGALYQAKRGHSPLVVIGGDAGIKYQAMDAQMAGDLVAFAKPVTKWSTMVMEPSSLLRVLRRAIKIATTPPTGPVYVCLPQDVLDAPAVEEVRPTSFPSTKVMPDEATLKTGATMLAAAQKPMIFVGDGVAFSGAQDELARVAELLGAEVWEADAGELNMSHAHPLYQGATGHMFGDRSLPITSKGDVNLVCGTYLLPEVFPERGNIFAPGAKAIHIDLNAYEIAKNHPVDLGIVSDPQLTIAKLANILEAIMTTEQKESAKARTTEITQAKIAKHESELARDRAVWDAVPLHLSRFMAELATQLPEDAIIFDEALTNSPAVTRYRPTTKPGHYFLTRGGSLGVGIPGAIGVKLANPDKTVIGLTGDGGAMYTIQALWSAARHNVDAKFIVCNNRSYRILQLNIQAYWKEQGIAEHDFPLCFDLSKPTIRFDEIARSMGVAAVRVEQPEEIAPAIKQALSHQGPFLIELILEGNVHPNAIGVRCGQ